MSKLFYCLLKKLYKFFLQPIYNQQGFTGTLIMITMMIGVSIGVKLLEKDISNMESNRIRATNDRMEKIAKRLDLYYAYNKNTQIISGDVTAEGTVFDNYKDSTLPCPAPLKEQIHTKEAGYEDTNCRTNFANDPDAVVVGAVPVSELGLPKSYALDGWGNKIIYVVTENNTAPSGAYNDSDYIDHTANVQIQDSQGLIMSNYLLLSYGPDGVNAFDPTGTIASCDISNGIQDNQLIVPSYSCVSSNTNIATLLHNKFSKNRATNDTNAQDDILFIGEIANVITKIHGLRFSLDTQNIKMIQDIDKTKDYVADLSSSDANTVKTAKDALECIRATNIGMIENVDEYSCLISDQSDDNESKLLSNVVLPEVNNNISKESKYTIQTYNDLPYIEGINSYISVGRDYKGRMEYQQSIGDTSFITLNNGINIVGLHPNTVKYFTEETSRNAKFSTQSFQDAQEDKQDFVIINETKNRYNGLKSVTNINGEFTMFFVYRADSANKQELFGLDYHYTATQTNQSGQYVHAKRNGSLNRPPEVFSLWAEGHNMEMRYTKNQLDTKDNVFYYDNDKIAEIQSGNNVRLDKELNIMATTVSLPEQVTTNVKEMLPIIGFVSVEEYQGEYFMCSSMNSMEISCAVLNFDDNDNNVFLAQNYSISLTTKDFPFGELKFYNRSFIGNEIASFTNNNIKIGDSTELQEITNNHRNQDRYIGRVRVVDNEIRFLKNKWRSSLFQHNKYDNTVWNPR